ncbi:hypothetical protein OSTOST_05131, partial [Ostertagia ostertagi]
MERRPRSIEQIEVIEHRIVEEGRRPVGSGISTAICNSKRHSNRYKASVPERFHLSGGMSSTGERDVSREPSFLHTSANFGQHIEPPASRLDTSGSRLNTSGQRVEFADVSGGTAVNNYGYDVHEIHTSEIFLLRGSKRGIVLSHAAPSSELRKWGFSQQRFGSSKSSEGGYMRRLTSN